MRVQRIMCPVDFSESSTAALDDAASLAKQLGAQLLIVHIDDHPLLSGAGSPSQSRKIDDCRTRLEGMQPRITGVAVEHHLVRGRAAEEIPRLVRTFNVDLVVMGRKHPDERFHLRHDGLCQIASRQCSCPVMTIQQSSPAVVWT